MSKIKVPNSSDFVSRDAARKIAESFLHDCGYHVPKTWIYEELLSPAATSDLGLSTGFSGVLIATEFDFSFGF